MRGISGLAEKLLASEEGLCSMELVRCMYVKPVWIDEKLREFSLGLLQHFKSVTSENC
jgi:hypothetical protein